MRRRTGGDRHPHDPGPRIRSEGVVPHGQRGGEDAEHEEGLRRGLVLDVVLDGVLEEEALRVELREEQRAEDGRVPRLADAVQVGGHAELGEVDGPHAEPLGRVHAEGHGQGVHAQLPVPLDGLEVVADGDPEASNGVKDREHDLLRGDGGRVEHGVAAPPGEGDVGGTQGEGARPAVGLELEGRGRVGVREEDADGGHEVHHGPLVPRPHVEPHGERDAGDQ
mmetsp:Transcript_7604/g.25876  ORF Transcript_7604/g.25876 Transcript_7604/m.25876 type:complete len:223 (-) Transcript_7604:570-1238(-)